MSEKSLDFFDLDEAKLKILNELDINDPDKNQQYSATGILALRQFNVFLTCNFDSNLVFAFELN